MSEVFSKMALNFELSYYPWITQGPSPAQIDAAVRLFGSALQSELTSLAGQDVTVGVSMAGDVSPQINRLVSEPRHIALINPLGYVFARTRSPAVDVVAVALRPDLQGNPGSTYRAQLYTAKKTAIRTLSQAKGKAFGFGVPFSTSNFLFPALMLKRAHRLFSFSRAAFLGGHPDVAKAVYEGRVDIGAGHDGVITGLAATPGYGDAEDVLVRLAWSDPIPSDPVAVNIPDKDEKAMVQKAIVSVGSRPDIVQQAVSVFWGGSLGLALTKSIAYDPVEQVLTELSLTQDDLLQS